MFFLFAIILVAVLYVYLHGKYNENYWKKRGVVFHPKNKTCGIHWDFITTDRAFFEIVGDLYRKYTNEPVVAFGSISRPTILIRDLININHVLQADFDSFSEGGTDTPEHDKLANSILFMQGNKWKLVRQSMSPLFTAAKLKNMFYIMDKSAQDFIEMLNKYPERLQDNTFDNLTNFTCASIAAAVFGIGTESVFDLPFLKMTRRALEPSFWTNFKFTFLAVLPALYKILKIKIFGVHEKPFIEAISRVIKERRLEDVKKHDFVDLCVALQKNGVLKDHKTQFEIEPTDELLAAQAFFYFVAGVEPCASAIFFTIMELGRNPYVLQRVHEEIDNLFRNINDKLSYENVTELEYLEKVINESLRMYPPAGMATRRCVKDAVLPTGNIKIEKGTHIIIPLFQVQRDPKYFLDPEIFNPNRFDTGSSEMPYMPFSKGNRMCIGARFARLLVKTGLVHILRHCTPETTIHGSEIKFLKQPFQVTPENVKIKLISRNISGN